MELGLSFAPLVPLEVLAVLAALAAVLVVLLAVLRPRGAVLRGLALVFGLLALANPSITREQREALPNVLAVVVDKSASQSFDHRAERTEEVRKTLEDSAKAFPNMQVREIEAGAPGSGSDGTELFRALKAGLADVPPDRVAGAVLITDGVVHDIPARAADLGFSAPLQALITGHPGERDRRVVLTATPRFGIVDKTQEIGFRVEDTGYPPGQPIEVVTRRDGEEIWRDRVTAGEEVHVEVPIAHAGPNVVEVEAEGAPGELTAVNNRAALSIQGVRDKLRVLLISGEPHSGERTWRNLLKSDANVDLVHFTILRPPEKQDGTPINELSLIAFPTRELFVTKIDQFDLIIFDRYSRQGILPMLYFDNIAEYVRQGGAVLVAAGADFAIPGSLADTPLASVLPAMPQGDVIERPYKPMVTQAGHRHPVTRDLKGDAPDPHWSHWFRLVESRPQEGEVVMSGPSDEPLLVLGRREKGRVAMFLSDHVWLWARGYEGGGPYLDLLRRLSHWLMKEPELEEEALRLTSNGNRIMVERQTMSDSAAPVTLTDPSGQARRIDLREAEPGLFRAEVDAKELGLYRATDGTFTALVNVGPANPREFREVASSTEHLAPLAKETGGSVRRVADAGGKVTVPRLVSVSASARAFGDDWIGVRRSEASVTRGLSLFPLFAGLVGLFLLLGVLAATWSREGR